MVNTAKNIVAATQNVVKPPAAPKLPTSNAVSAPAPVSTATQPTGPKPGQVTAQTMQDPFKGMSVDQKTSAIQNNTQLQSGNSAVNQIYGSGPNSVVSQRAAGNVAGAEQTLENATGNQNYGGSNILAASRVPIAQTTPPKPMPAAPNLPKQPAAVNAPEQIQFNAPTPPPAPNIPKETPAPNLAARAAVSAPDQVTYDSTAGQPAAPNLTDTKTDVTATDSTTVED